MSQSKTPIFFLNLASQKQQSPQPSAFIFDETYKTKLQKHRFERNPKFAYFNTVMRIRNKLSNQQHQIYQMVFDPQANNQQNRWKNLQLSSRIKNNHGTTADWKNQPKKQVNQQKKQFQSKAGQTYRHSVRQISFQKNAIHKRRQSQIYYDRKPKLDDILAEYRRMATKQKLKSKSFYDGSSKSNRKNNKNQFPNFNQTNKLLSRQFNKNAKPKKSYQY